MTDNEIIKALECCLSSNDLAACWKCPAVKLNICCDGSSKISNGITHNVIDLINRQKAEIERLTTLCTEQNEEISRLQKVRANILNVMKENISQTQAEVIKEFAERLNQRVTKINHSASYMVDESKVYNAISDTLKEMVGDNDE